MLDLPSTSSPAFIVTPFKPAWWCRNRHLQTLLPQLRIWPRPEYQREVVDLPDGDFVDLDWLHAKKKPTSIVILIHGLGGSSRSSYIRSLATTLKKSNMTTAVINLRGCSGRPNRRAKTYHSGHTEDLHFIASKLRKKYPNTPIFAVGFSLGGNALLKWLGEDSASIEIDGAIAVSVPFVLSAAAEYMKRGFSTIYQNKLVTDLKQSARNRKALFLGKIDYEHLESYRDFPTFDHQVTAPINGFYNGEDYYKTSSCRQYLKNIQTPTLIIHSKDDPFMPSNVVPDQYELGTGVTLNVYEKGGHVGFIGRTHLGYFWLNNAVSEYIFKSVKY